MEFYSAPKLSWAPAAAKRALRIFLQRIDQGQELGLAGLNNPATPDFYND
jgi:hypothetical protein